MNKTKYKISLSYEDMNGISIHEDFYSSVGDVKNQIDEMKKCGLILFAFDVENKDWIEELEKHTGLTTHK